MKTAKKLSTILIINTIHKQFLSFNLSNSITPRKMNFTAKLTTVTDTAMLLLLHRLLRDAMMFCALE